jgi:pyruvate-formate lyase-activating enzyme
MYEEIDGKILEKYPNEWTRCDTVDVEQIPLFHIYPNSRFLQLGGFNCNASCAYCINSSMAINPQEVFTNKLTPVQIADRATTLGCIGIHFGINEVTVNLPSALALAREAKTRGLAVGCSSNGYFTPEAAEMMAGAFDFFNISLKSISDQFYQEYTGLRSAAVVMRNIEYLAARAHLEVTTPIVQDQNEDEIPAIVEYLSGIDPEIAWHVFRLIPRHQMSTATPPNVEKLAKMIESTRRKLPFIYFGNFIGSTWVDTICPQCGEILIERLCVSACGAKFIKQYLQSPNCPQCGRAIPVRYPEPGNIALNTLGQDPRDKKETTYTR